MRRSRQEKYPERKWFTYKNMNPKNRITGDCVIRAIALALEQDYNKTLKEIVEVQLKTGYMIDTKECYGRYLESKGWIKCKQPRWYDNTKWTGREFCDKLQQYLGDHEVEGAEWDCGVIIEPRIIANIGGHHLTAIIDGKITDHWDCSRGTIGNYWIKKR